MGKTGRSEPAPLSQTLLAGRQLLSAGELLRTEPRAPGDTVSSALICSRLPVGGKLRVKKWIYFILEKNNKEQALVSAEFEHKHTDTHPQT